MPRALSISSFVQQKELLMMSLPILQPKNGAKVFRGSLEDKLDRWYGAVQHFGLDAFVTMDGDDLFCDPSLMTEGAKQLEAGGYDFLKAPADLACGAFTYAIKASALAKVCSIKKHRRYRNDVGCISRIPACSRSVNCMLMIRSI